MATWTNWAGTEKAERITIERPDSTEAVAEVVRRAREDGRGVKAIGAGHSCSGIASPEDVQVDLAAINGLFACDRRSGSVTVGAGTTLRKLNRILSAVGLALANMGDSESQTLAGAIATGTHGTGLSFGSISTQVTGLEMVLADATIVNCSAEEYPELFSAARLGLGALGIVTRVSLRCVRSFTIRSEDVSMDLDEFLLRFDELAGTCDHFDARWYPHTRTVTARCNLRLPLAEGVDRLPRWRSWLEEELIANRLAGLGVRIGMHLPELIPAANTVAARLSGSREFTDVSYKVFTTPRHLPTRDMEFALPFHVAPVALKDLVDALRDSDMRLGFPVRLRVGAADDIPLSPASERTTAYLAVQVPASLDHNPYFKMVAKVLDPYRPRPHWGKLHDLDAEILRTRYPAFDEFVRLRDKLDPDGILSNRYLDRVLGPPPGRAGFAPIDGPEWPA